jgi:hypothetical protein
MRGNPLKGKGVVRERVKKRVSRSSPTSVSSEKEVSTEVCVLQKALLRLLTHLLLFPWLLSLHDGSGWHWGRPVTG